MIRSPKAYFDKIQHGDIRRARPVTLAPNPHAALICRTSTLLIIRPGSAMDARGREAVATLAGRLGFAWDDQRGWWWQGISRQGLEMLLAVVGGGSVKVEVSPGVVEYRRQK